MQLVVARFQVGIFTGQEAFSWSYYRSLSRYIQPVPKGAILAVSADQPCDRAVCGYMLN